MLSSGAIDSKSKTFNVISDKDHDFSITISIENSDSILIKGKSEDDTIPNYSTQQNIDEIKKKYIFYNV